MTLPPGCGAGCGFCRGLPPSDRLLERRCNLERTLPPNSAFLSRAGSAFRESPVPGDPGLPLRGSSCMLKRM